MKPTLCPSVKILNNPGVRDYYVCADIYGNVDTLTSQLKQAGFNPDMDRLVCTGNIADRGNQSKEAALLLREDWFESVYGNHEEMLLNTLALGLKSSFHMNNGGRWLLDLNQVEIYLIESLYKNLPYAIEIQHKGFKYGIVHADVLGNDWEGFKSMLLTHGSISSWLHNTYYKCDVHKHAIWSRERFHNIHQDMKKINGVDAVFFGHNITPRPLRKENMFFIDTGAYISGKITVIKLDPVNLEVIGQPTLY